MKDGHIELVSGAYSAIAMVTPAIKQGVAFSEFLKPSMPANVITPRVPDPITMNYRYKIASARVTRIGESTFKHSFSQMSFKRRDIT